MRYLLLLAPAVLLAGPPRYARVGEFAGQVETQARAPEGWIAAERNAPLPESAQVRTVAGSRIEIELDEGSAVRLGPNSQVELSDYSRLSTGQRVTLLSFDHGVAYISGAPEGRDALALAVPGAQVTFTRGARVRLQVEEQWSQITVLRGGARFSSPAADMELREGQTTRVEPANAARFFFYKEALPLELDQWSAERDDALESPTSAAHVVQRYGLADLDGAGEWIITQDLGAVWRPKTAEGWRPFESGRWRWYDDLGYTWISDEAWGWLPYHYGRWTRLDNLGWVWAPSKNGIFKPGEVYWLRGKNFIGWGPLAPGEQWDPADPVNALPQQFLHVNTTYAQWRANAAVIDPAGFTGGPRGADFAASTGANASVKIRPEALKGVEFFTALPSPPFLAAKLDAVRPLVNAATLRVKPVVDGVTIETAARAPARPQPAGPAPAPTVVVVTQPATQPPPDPEIVEVPVPVPAGIVFVKPDVGRRPARSAAPSAPATQPPAFPAVATGRRDKGPRAPVAGKKFRNPAESALVNTIVQELDARSYQKAVADLDQWTERFHDTDFADERAYYYMLAFHGLDQPVKVLDRSTPLVSKPANAAFEDPMQALSVLYITAVNYQKVSRPMKDQSATARAAAQQLLAILPACFTAEHKPEVMSASDWAKSRTDLEKMARETLARAGR
jgi:hypothetical protein